MKKICSTCFGFGHLGKPECKPCPKCVGGLKEVKPRNVSTLKESDVHLQVCKYLKAQYPKVLFLSDFGAGIKLTPGMAARQSMQKSNHSFPDLMIFERDINDKYNGLFLELKRDKDALYTKSGQYLKSDHIAAQLECLYQLRDRGYKAEFACGFDEAKLFIDTYFRLF